MKEEKGLRMSINDFDLGSFKTSIHYPFVNFIINIHILKTKDPNHNLLLPPAGGPGVQRWLKFVKYLPDFVFSLLCMFQRILRTHLLMLI
jgi:hypothetical protein